MPYPICRKAVREARLNINVTSWSARENDKLFAFTSQPNVIYPSLFSRVAEFAAVYMYNI